MNVIRETTLFTVRFRFWLNTSVTRLGDFLDFGQIFKAFGNNKIAQIFHILKDFL